MSRRLHLALIGLLSLGGAAAVAVAFMSRDTGPHPFTRKAYAWEGFSEYGRMHPAELDNRDLIGPILDQKDTEQCGLYAWAGYITARRWQHFGELMPTDPNAVLAAVIETERASGHHTEEQIQDKHAFCDGCMGETVARLLDLPPETARHLKPLDNHARTIDTVKRMLHRFGYIVADFVPRCEWAKERMHNGAYTIAHGGCDTELNHTVILCGYTADGFIVANSWGRTWGAKGFGVLPYSDFADQFREAHFFIEPTHHKPERKHQ